MEPLFYKGQRVTCVNRGNKKSAQNGFTDNPLIEGKTYTVTDPTAIVAEDCVFIEVSGSDWRFNQNQFIPETLNDECEEEIKRSLNSHLLIKTL